MRTWPLAVAGDDLYLGGTHGVFEAPGATPWVARNEGMHNSKVRVIALDPSSPSTVCSMTQPSIFKSLDSGQSWFSIHGDLPTDAIHELVLDPDDPRTLWAATEHGLFRNRDSGPSWQPFNEGRPHEEVRAMAYRASTQTLYVGTRGGGVYQMSLALLIDGFESGDTTAWSASAPP